MIKKSRIIIITITIILIITCILSYTFYADVTTLYNTKVTIKDIYLQELSFTYCKLKIYIDLSNPSDRDISGLTAVFDIYIADSYIGRGSFSKISIPAKSTKEKDVTVTIYYANIAVAVVDGIKKGDFDLTIKGEAKGYALFDLITVSKQFKATKSYI